LQTRIYTELQRAAFLAPEQKCTHETTLNHTAVIWCTATTTTTTTTTTTYLYSFLVSSISFPFYFIFKHDCVYDTDNQ